MFCWLKAVCVVEVIGNEVHRSLVRRYELIWVGVGLCLRFAIPVDSRVLSFLEYPCWFLSFFLPCHFQLSLRTLS